MAFGVADLVALVASVGVELDDDASASRRDLVVVPFDIVDEHIQHAADAATRAVCVHRRSPDGYEAFGNLDLRPARRPVGLLVMARDVCSRNPKTSVSQAVAASTSS